MGTGKTRTTLFALRNELLLTGGPFVIVGTKRIIATQKVWQHEAEEVGLNFQFQLVHGPGALKRAKADADIYLTTYDMLKSQAGQLILSKARIIVFDELTYLKAFTARFKAVRAHLPTMVKRWGLTGTPAPNGLEDLFYQVQAIDCGKRWGKNKNRWRDRYFYSLDPHGYKWKPRDEDAIHASIADLCHRVGNEGLPEIVPQPVHVPLTPELRKQYKALERDFLLRVGDDLITAPSAATLSNKLRQLCAGFVYHEDGTAKLSSDRLNAVKALLDELQGEQALITYQFLEQRDQLLSAIPDAETLDSPGAIDRWNAGELPALVLHPKSGSHGLNLQHSQATHVIWMSMSWELDLWLQCNRRLARPGGADTVFAHVLMAPGTVEEKVYREVLTSKAGTEARLLEAIS